MTPLAILADLRARGIAIRAEGELLKLRPKSALTPGDYDRLRAAKPDLLRLLRPALVLPLRRGHDGTPHPHRLAPPATACATCGGRRFWTSVALTGWHCETCREPVASPVWQAADEQRVAFGP